MAIVYNEITGEFEEVPEVRSYSPTPSTRRTSTSASRTTSSRRTTTSSTTTRRSTTTRSSASTRSTRSASSSGNSNTPRPVRSVPTILKTSQALFDEGSYIHITRSGYYLEINGKFYKLANLKTSVSGGAGQIWRMRPLTRGYKFNLIHYVDPDRYVIGEVKLTSSDVTFKDENGHIERFPL